MPYFCSLLRYDSFISHISGHRIAIPKPGYNHESGYARRFDTDPFYMHHYAGGNGGGNCDHGAEA